MYRNHKTPHWMGVKTPHWMGVFFFLAGLGVNSEVHAKKNMVALFVQTEGQKPEAQRTGALLNWMVQEIHRRGKNPTQLLDRGLFFSRSEALSGQRWREKAARVAEEGYQSYLGDPAEALRFMYRSARFYEYAYTYAMNRHGARKSLLYLGCLLYRKGDKSLGRRRLTQGILINPQAAPPTSLNAEEQQLVQAMRCRLGKARTGKLVLKTPFPAVEVYVNGYLIGFGSSQLELPPGEYYVKATLDGYRHWGRRIEVRSGQTRNVSVYMQKSPRHAYYTSLCGKLGQSQAGEQLTDEIKKIRLTMQTGAAGNVKALWFACFKPQGSGNTGTLTWYGMDFSQESAQAQKGTLSLPTGFKVRWNALGNILQKVGSSPAPTSQAPDSVMLYPAIPSSAVCIDPEAIRLSPLLPPQQSSSGGWLVSTNDSVVIYTKYGFRLQGKVLEIRGDMLILQVAEETEPQELQAVKIDRKQVQLHWSLGKQQHRGYRIGERLVVRSIHGLTLLGNVVSSTAQELRLKTRQGVETLPWAMIKTVFRRDR